MNICKRAVLLALTGGILMTTGCAGSDSSSQTPQSSAADTTTTTTTAATTTTTTTTTTTAFTFTEPELREPSEYGKVIALTFDDGPNTSTTNAVLDVLEKYDARASFFLIGNNITEDCHEVMKRTVSMGCEINSHSLTHSYMNTMKPDEIVAEMDATAKLIEDVIGVGPKFFRPPYIAVNYTMWDNIDLPFISGYGCNDWDPKVTTEQRVETVLSQAKDGAIILLHDAQGNYQTVEALEQIIPELQAQGYELVTLTELFHAKGVTPKAVEKEYTDYMIYSYAEQTSTWG